MSEYSPISWSYHQGHVTRATRAPAVTKLSQQNSFQLFVERRVKSRHVIILPRFINSFQQNIFVPDKFLLSCAKYLMHGPNSFVFGQNYFVFAEEKGIRVFLATFPSVLCVAKLALRQIDCFSFFAICFSFQYFCKFCSQGHALKDRCGLKTL